MKRSISSTLAALTFASAAAASDPAAKAINQLGLDLHKRLAEANEAGNLCLSPYSIQCAMLMTYEGASGATAEEMAKVLHYPQEGRDFPGGALIKLTGDLEAIAKKSEQHAEMVKSNGYKEDPIAFCLANRLFGQEGYPFSKPYLEKLDQVYHAPLEPMNFAEPAIAAKHINDWVEQQTKERIKDLVSEKAINASTRLLLANAVYMKASWANPFSKRATISEPFSVVGADKTDVPTMGLKTKSGYAKRNGYEAVTIPYAGGELQFLVLLPDARKGLAEMEKKLTDADLEACAKLPVVEVELHLPKFRIEASGISLADEFKALGMKKAFNEPAGSADFSLIAAPKEGNGLEISDIIHKTFISVDEEGTEAAASTMVMIAFGSIEGKKPEPVVMKVDRPFLFAIQHVSSGACLFLGRITDPR